tara:strand:+ start:3202 stop:3426 length:225 start_codon:yes stop_codon:yes gene_type:complete
MVNMKNSNEATPKSPAIDSYLTKLTGVSRVGAVAEGSCTICGEMAKSFTDALSAKEYTISGMCQPCQDSVFGDE